MKRLVQILALSTFGLYASSCTNEAEPEATNGQTSSISEASCTNASDCETAGSVCLLGICNGEPIEECSEGTCTSDEGCLLNLQSHCDGCSKESACVAAGACDSDERECLPGGPNENPVDAGM